MKNTTQSKLSRSKKAFLKKRHTNGQKTNEKILKFTNY